MGKIRINRIRVNQKPKSSFVIPSQKQKGLESHAEADPVIAKTINMMVDPWLDYPRILNHNTRNLRTNNFTL